MSTFYKPTQRRGERVIYLSTDPAEGKRETISYIKHKASRFQSAWYRRNANDYGDRRRHASLWVERLHVCGGPKTPRQVFGKLSVEGRTMNVFAVLLRVCCMFFVITLSGSAQEAENGPSSYDVVSIKLEQKAPTSMGVRYTASGFEASAVSLADLVKEAYGLTDVRLVKGTSSFKDAYHIVAKLSDQDIKAIRNLPPEALKATRHAMLQQILAERFQIAAHSTPMSLGIYSLQVASRGVKLSEVTESPIENGGDAKVGSVSNYKRDSFFADGRIRGLFSMGQLARILSLSRKVGSDASDRSVVDETHLTGNFLVDLAWTGPSDAPPPMVSADTQVYGSAGSALEAVGLRLVPKDIQVDGIVVDHASAPTPN